MTDRAREYADWGFEDGWDAAMNEVNDLMHEMYAEQKPDLAESVHAVWQRLRERQDAALATRKAKRAARDQYAAEVAAKQS